MQGLSYNLSQDLKTLPERIESLKRQILLTPLAPKTELRLKWEANIERIYWSLKIENHPLSKKDTISTLTREIKQISTDQQEVINYKRALDYITQNWLVSPKTISTATLKELYEIAILPTVDTKDKTFLTPERTLKASLDYLQAGEESPIIQAAAAQALIENLKPISEKNGKLARLLAHLFLYKHGYDFRGLLVLEEYWRKDMNSYQQALESVQRSNNLTLWIEYFTKGVVVQLNKAVQSVKDRSFKTETSPRYFELNDRQKEVMRIVQQPELKVTNRKVQQICKISQITASRDLRKLVNLGLLFPHGKGRSVYYTRA